MAVSVLSQYASVPGPYTGGVQGGALAPPFQINDIQLAHLKTSLH